MTSEELLEEVARFYLESGDFNGMPVRSLGESLDDVRDLARPLIESGHLYVNYGDRHPNPHVLAFEPEDKADQLLKLDEADLASACLYPTVAHMKTVVNPADYEGRRQGQVLGHRGPPALPGHAVP